MSDTDKDILTLVREIAILREENLDLKEKLDKIKARPNYYPLMKSLMGFMAWLANNYNPNVSDRAIAYIDKYNLLLEKHGMDPVLFENVERIKAGAEKLIE